MDQLVFFSVNVAETTKTGGLLSRTSKVQKKCIIIPGLFPPLFVLLPLLLQVHG